MLGNIGPMELFIVLLIVLVLFGAKRLPEMGASLGKGIREFKHGLSSDTDRLDTHDREMFRVRELPTESRDGG